MSATGTPTPNLGLRIPLGTDPAAVEDINYNAGVLDTKIGAIGNDTVKGLLDHAGDEINALGDGLAIIANGNTHAAIAAGEFVFVRNHGSLATGLYKATTAIAANGALSSSNLTADSKGGLNSLSDQTAKLAGTNLGNYNGDLNNVTETGYYYFANNSNITNCPTSTGWLHMIVISVSEDYATQIIFETRASAVSSSHIWVRSKSQSTWRPWFSFNADSSV